MDTCMYILVILTILSSCCQVVEAANIGLAVGATLGITVFIGIFVFLRYCYWDKKCAHVEPDHRPKEKQVVHKVTTAQHPQPQVGHQPYPGQPQHHPPPPMYQGNVQPPGMMHNDPAYPPSMPAGGGGPAPQANPFTAASHGY